jgi:hypothetical protein
VVVGKGDDRQAAARATRGRRGRGRTGAASVDEIGRHGAVQPARRGNGRTSRETSGRPPGRSCAASRRRLGQAQQAGDGGLPFGSPAARRARALRRHEAAVDQHQAAVGGLQRRQHPEAGAEPVLACTSVRLSWRKVPATRTRRYSSLAA